MTMHSDHRCIGIDNQCNARKHQLPGNLKDNVAGNDKSEGRFHQVLTFGRQFLCSKNAFTLYFQGYYFSFQARLSSAVQIHKEGKKEKKTIVFNYF